MSDEELRKLWRHIDRLEVYSRINLTMATGILILVIGKYLGI